MIVVADASPLIFLGKLRQLDLVFRVVGEDVRLPEAVLAEIVTADTEPAELRVLRPFLARCTVEPVRRPNRYASGMSKADNAAVTLAVRSAADFLLCDERITRLMAEAEGIRPLGTIGVLLRALRAGEMTRRQARTSFDRLVDEHSFRIGIELYRAVLAEIERR